MTDLGQPRHVTAGRPLPPRKAPPIGPAANDLPLQPAAVVPPVAPPSLVPSMVPPVVAERQRPAKPDPRPMRLAFGAAAVAAVSFMVGGFVRPGFGSAADQPADAQALGADSTDVDGGNGQRRELPQRVTRYVFLAPGQNAPPGATVISASDSPREGDQKASRAPAPADATTRATQRAPAAQPRVTTRQSGG